MDGQGSTWMTGPKGEKVPTHSGMAQLWPTATTRDYKGGTTDDALTRKDGKTRMDQLPNIAERFPSAQDETNTGLGRLLREIIPIYYPRKMLFRLRTPLNEMSDAELMVLWQQLSKIGG
jgi:hypothetical protein